MGAMRLWLPAVATGLLTISPFANANVITINVTDGGPGVNTNATSRTSVVVGHAPARKAFYRLEWTTP